MFINLYKDITLVSVIASIICVVMSCGQNRQAYDKKNPLLLEDSLMSYQVPQGLKAIDSVISIMKCNTDFCNVTVEDGLPSQDVRCILRDDAGYVWIGTNNGVARFDGAHIYVCQATTSESVWSMVEIGPDTLLIGTSLGLRLYSRKQEHLETLNIPSTIVKTLCKLQDGNVLIGTEDGLYIWERHQAGRHETTNLKRVRVETGMGGSNHITSLMADGKKGCWLSTANGLGYYNISSRQVKMYRMPEEKENSNFFNSMSRYGDKIFLGSFNKGIYVFDSHSHSFSKEEGFEHNLILKTFIYGHYLLVGTNGLGLKIKNLRTGDVWMVKNNIKEHGTLSSNTVQEICVINGMPWIGTQFGGMCYLPRFGKVYDVYSFNDFSSSDYSVRYFLDLNNGAKLVATRLGLFYIDEKKHLIKHYAADDSESTLRSNIITYIGNIGGHVLIGTYGGGIHIFENNTLTLRDYSHEEVALYGCVFDMTEIKDSSVWLATQEGLYCMSKDRKVTRHFTTENSRLKSNAIYKLYADAFGRLWVGTYAGLYLVDIKTCNILPCAAIPATAKVNHLLPDVDNTIWVATDQGLYHIDADLKVVEKYDVQTGLPENDVVALKRENALSMWIATRHAIILLDMSDTNSTSRMHIKLSGNENFNNAPAVCDTSYLWWCSEKGLVGIKRKYDASARHIASKPQVSSYAIDDVYTLVYGEDKSIEVPASAKQLTFLLTNLLYATDDFCAYECMLEGYDKEWHILEGENTLSYADLPSGNYVFKVRDPKSKHGSQINVHVQINSKVMLAIVCGLVVLICLIWYSLHKIKFLRNRLKKERKVLSDAIYSKKQTMQARKSTAENLDEIEERLLEYMQQEKPYLNAHLTIGELAAAISSTEADISLLLNNKMNINWSNFVNAYRVDEVKQRLLNGDLDKYTLTTLAEQCGFVSKTTFFRVFKQNTGMTPAEYYKQNNISAS